MRLLSQCEFRSRGNRVRGGGVEEEVERKNGFELMLLHCA